MRKSFFKTALTDNISPSIQEFDGILDVLNKAKVKHINKNTPYILINRNEHFKEAIRTINSEMRKALVINGFYGVGKTEFIKSLFLSLDDSILRFYYECSQITNLDDIIVSLYSYLNKFFKKNTELARDIKASSTLSIDRKVIEYIKNLKRPLIIAIDSLEFLTDKNFNFADEEIAKFLNYLLKFPNIKLIISSQKLLVSGLNLNEKNSSRIKLGGLDDNHALQIFKDHNLIGYENTLYQAFEITRGYPESLLWFINGVINLKITPFDLIGEYSSRKESFEEYIIEKIYDIIPQDCIKLCRFLSALRHPVKISLLQKLNAEGDLEHKINKLKELMIVTDNNGNYYIKPMIKNLIYKHIATNEKGKIHNFLHEFYSNQIPKPINEREITLSRKLLHTEQYYHYKISTKFKTNFNILASTPNQFYDFKKSQMPPAQKNPNKQEKQQSKNIENTNEESVLNFEDNETVNIDNNFKKKLIETIQDMDDDDLGFELSDDEKKLLEEESINEDLSREKTDPSKLIIPIFFQENDQTTEQEEKISPTQERKELLEKADEFQKAHKLDLAFYQYKKALNLSKSLGDKKQVAQISIQIADILAEMHKYEDAAVYYNESIDFYQQENDYITANKVNNMLGNAYSESYKHDEALKAFKRVINDKNNNLNNEILSEAYTGLAEIYDYRKNAELAITYYLKSLQFAEKNETAQSKEQYALTAFKLALVYDDMNNISKALEYYKKCAEFQNIEQNIFLAEALANIAAIYEENNNFDNALNFYQKSLNVDRINKNFDGEYKTINKLANIYIYQGNNDKALDYLNMGLESAKSSKDIYLVAGSLFDLGDFFLNVRDYEKSLKNFILSRKTIGATISTDSSEKIDRKIRQIMNEIGEVRFNIIMERIKNAKGR
ncbi:MAG: tetratricopeptide repeat protein [bacterium]